MKVLVSAVKMPSFGASGSSLGTCQLMPSFLAADEKADNARPNGMNVIVMQNNKALARSECEYPITFLVMSSRRTCL